MAEYIDRENAKSLIEVAIEDNWDLDYTLERFKEIDSTDVVERSKIDKAIEEAIKYRDDDKNDFCEVEVGAINGVLQILKRNIGE